MSIMGTPTLARIIGALIFTILYVMMWRRYRPSTRQHIAAALAGLAVALYDWAGEVVLYRLGVWHYEGGLKSIDLAGHQIDFLNVPMEMPLGFIPCGMAMCFALLIPARLRERGIDRPLAKLTPRQLVLGVFAVTLVAGPLIDSTYNRWTGSVVYDMGYFAVMAYTTPLWLGGAATCLVTYGLALRWLGKTSAFEVFGGD